MALTERRQFLKDLAVFGAILTLFGPTGCSSPQPQPQLKPPSPEPKPAPLPAAKEKQTTGKVETQGWPEIKVPSEIPQGNLFTINNIKPFQSSEIGLEQLHLNISNDYPVVGICSFYNPAKVKTLRNNQPIGFQEISNPFIPNPSLVPDTIPTSAIPGGVFKQFIQETIAKVESIRESTPLESIIIKIVPRPPEGKEVALVSGQGLMIYEGKPSPQSFLAVKFNFEPISGPTPKGLTL